MCTIWSHMLFFILCYWLLFDFVQNLSASCYRFFGAHAWIFFVQCRFLLPATLIVINDIFAYICGFFFGKTPLIKLSPKKTWEGFIGASITTMISAFVVSMVSPSFLLDNFLGIKLILITFFCEDIQEL